MNFDFRTLNYLGSKLRLLGFIEGHVQRITPERAGVCDLFAGSGCVSYRLSRQFPVVACDIQHYSRVINNALLRKYDDVQRKVGIFLRMLQSKVNCKDVLLDAFNPLIEFEENAIGGKDALSLTNVIEHGSVEVYNLERNVSPIDSLLLKVSNALRRRNIDDERSLISRYYGGVYFSYRQAVQMDILLELIFKEISVEERDLFLAPLLSAASDVVDTVGKHFAQPIRARDSSGNIKPLVCNKALKDKTVDVITLYVEWLRRYAALPKACYNSLAVQGDFEKCLETLPADVRTVYADPPYTREHYSRFYHVLETISLRDTPKVSTVKTHGKIHVSNGIYRAGRFQSPFCIKSQAIGAFDRMFALSAEDGRNMVLSYSPYDQSKNSHPRVVTIDQIVEVAEKYYKKVEIISAGTFHHNKLNSVEHKLEAADEAELLIVSTNAR